MGEFQINGGKRLSGRLRITGGKNAVLPILAATVINGDESVIHNCPMISDTFTTVEILEKLGCAVKREGSTLTVDSSGADKWEVPVSLAKEMRSSTLFMGGLLGRFGKAAVSHPGGCNLGDRPIDLHEYALSALGAKVETIDGIVHCRTEGLSGAQIVFSLPSVGATENAMIAAVCAPGVTVIMNAAREPEIVDLQKFLNSMGADVRGAGTIRIEITGGKRLRRAEHTVMPDRITTGTYLAAAAITGGSIFLTDVTPEDMTPVTMKLREAGCVVKEGISSIFLDAPRALNSVSRITTQPHPGLPDCVI
ncbi:MAG: UDP-N-acetylglucosamine 1-carboxyvinyltransferase [Defluviitaleaceae bacterium]|nr:UDP-N-acetylglucosamine 1-carboxyvinyltransferase [Defluviitaleaceae bacterium]